MRPLFLRHRPGGVLYRQAPPLWVAGAHTPSPAPISCKLTRSFTTGKETFDAVLEDVARRKAANKGVGDTPEDVPDCEEPPAEEEEGGEVCVG